MSDKEKPCRGVACFKFGLPNTDDGRFSCGAHCSMCFGAGWIEVSPHSHGSYQPCSCSTAWRRFRERGDGKTHLECRLSAGGTFDCSECRQLTGTSAPLAEVEQARKDRMWG